MHTVAEGVETCEQLQMLRLIKCDQAQGFLFARPVQVADVPSVIARLPIAALRQLQGTSPADENAGGGLKRRLNSF
jgi:predicted signal transduction protein with EAL and GGDEF domain